ncbi:MAG: hypothetical protein K8R79_07030 [Calditrichales bacterium]|nr:hypothetical protein [Calditrichales bacterium]
MAARNIAHADIMRGRNITFTIMDDTSPTPVEVLSLKEIKDGIVSGNEEIKTSDYPVEDGTEIINDYARKFIFEFVFSELDATDIAAINAAGKGEIQVQSDEGGANDTGKLFTVTTCDKIRAVVEDMKTKVTAIKNTADVSTLPYTITDIAA